MSIPSKKVEYGLPSGISRKHRALLIGSLILFKKRYASLEQFLSGTKQTPRNRCKHNLLKYGRFDAQAVNQFIYLGRMAT
jgi:hypothetical protein